MKNVFNTASLFVCAMIASSLIISTARAEESGSMTPPAAVGAPAPGTETVKPPESNGTEVKKEAPVKIAKKTGSKKKGKKMPSNKKMAKETKKTTEEAPATTTETK